MEKEDWIESFKNDFKEEYLTPLKNNIKMKKEEWLTSFKNDLETQKEECLIFFKLNG